MLYKITLDNRKSIFDDLPSIEAKSPIRAAEMYVGCKVTRHNFSGDVVVESPVFPYKQYVYRIERIKP